MTTKSQTDNTEFGENKKSSVELSLSDKFPYLDNIINQYEIKHPKPSISRNTAKKMLVRDLAKLIAEQDIKSRIDELEKAVQQFIFNTKSNPHNFSEYATDRLKQLSKRNKGEDNE